MVTVTKSPSESYAHIVSSYQQKYGDPGPSTLRLDTPLQPQVILDEEGGLIVSLMASLEQTIRAGEPTGDWETDEDHMSDEERTALLREHRTWQLIRAVMENRTSREGFEPPSAETQLADDPYIPPEDLTQTIVNESPELSLYATLVDHLQSRPLLNIPPPLEARHGYLPATVRREKAKMLQDPTYPPSSVDPDFTLRNPQGQGLAGEDLAYQKPLMETLWDHVRHGELDQAIRVCNEGGEPWRGASLMGGRRWTMGGLAQDSAPGGLEGNKTRNLWKKACRALARNPTLLAAERHLYAALISDLPTLLPACETWEDYVWANVQARMESAIEQRRKELGGFWYDEEVALGQDDGEETIGGLDEVFMNIAKSGSNQARIEATDAYIVAQRMIIQGRTEALLDQLVDNIPQLQETMTPQLLSPLLRFFAHLVLVLRALGQSVPDDAANLILQAYVSVLQQEGNDQLVAMYAACLREGTGEQSYARFLRSMDPSAPRETKIDALHRARQHNLDVAVIAKETVRMILEVAFANIPALSGDQPHITAFASGLTESDVTLIRAIEWLTLGPETAHEALVQSDAVARYFLALGNAAAAQALLKTLPADLATSQQDDDYHATEHEHYRALFAVFACHEAVDDVLARTPKNTATKMEQHSWRKNLVSAIERTERITIELLTNDWLRFEESSLRSDSARRAELARIRQVFIPDLVFRLHALLTSHYNQAPSLLQQALELVKIVADEDNHVYAEFFGRGSDPYRLTAYLDKVQSASLLALQAGGTPFAVVAT